MFLAHGAEIREVVVRLDFWNRLGHQPTWISLILISLLVLIILVLGRKLSLPNRLFIVVPLLLVISIFYMAHNPIVTSITLSVGFIVTFLLTFTLLASNRRS